MADSELHRTHPATVVVRTLTMLTQAFGALIALAFAGTLGGREGVLGMLGIGGLVLAGIAITVVTQWVKWYFFRFGVVDTHLVIHEGWIVRKRRSIPVGRVQGVDVRAGLVMRMLGMADVVVQTAGGGGGEPEAKIGAIPLSQAERLRAELLHRKTWIGAAGAETAIGPDPIGRMSDLRGVFGGAEAAMLASSFEHRTGVARLALAAMTSKSVPVIMAAILGGASQLIEFADSSAIEGATRAALAAGVIGVVLGGLVLVAGVVAVAVVVTVTRDFGFTVRRVEDRIETEAGLFERRMTGLPVSRIQTVSVERSALRRLLGWGSIHVVTAGFGRGEDETTTTAAAIVPIARASELPGLLDDLLPEAAVFPALHPLPRRSLRFYVLLPTSVTALVTALGVLAVVLLAPDAFPVAAFVAILATAVTAVWCAADWRQTSLGTDERAFGLLRGVLGRYQVRVPHSRIQTLSIRQNPFQKPADLATLIIATVSGSSKTLYRVRHIDVSEAERIAAWFSARPGVTAVTRTSA